MYDDFDRIPGGRRVHEIDQQLNHLHMEREQLIAAATIKPLEPKDATLVRLALEAGEMKSAFRAQYERAEKQEKLATAFNEENIKLRRELADTEHSLDMWRGRAQYGEDYIKRSKAAKLAIRKKKAKK